MKKFLFASACIALAFSFGASAQHYDNSRFGVVAGLTSTSTSIKNVDTKSVSLYHAGLALELPVGAGFAIQPELLYQVKGMSIDQWSGSTGKDVTSSFQTRVGYIEVPVQIQWGPDLMLFRPYGFVEPFLGYQISSAGNRSGSTISNELQKVEYGLSVGAGIELWHLQLSAKYFWNFGNVYNTDIKSTGSTIASITDSNTFNGVAVSLALFF